MAKPARQPRGASKAGNRARLIKLRLTDDEMRVVRMAAAIDGARPGEFVRKTILEQAQRLVDVFAKEHLSKSTG